MAYHEREHFSTQETAAAPLGDSIQRGHATYENTKRRATRLGELESKVYGYVVDTDVAMVMRNALPHDEGTIGLTPRHDDWMPPSPRSEYNLALRVELLGETEDRIAAIAHLTVTEKGRTQAHEYHIEGTSPRVILKNAYTVARRTLKGMRF